MLHGDLADQHEEKKAPTGSGWWAQGEKKQLKDMREEPEDNEPGDIPDVWHPKPILKRKIYSKALWIIVIIAFKCIYR